MKTPKKTPSLSEVDVNRIADAVIEKMKKTGYFTTPIVNFPHTHDRFWWGHSTPQYPIIINSSLLNL